MRKTFHIAGFLMLFCGTVYAQGYKVGEKVADFTLEDVTTGKKVSLSDYNTYKGVVVIFVANYCPYSKLYEERIMSMANEYGGKKMAFLLINPNNPTASPNDSEEDMRKKAKERGYQIPYLADASQKIADAFGAKKTPEAFVLKNKGEVFTLYYRGAFDDSPQSVADIRERYVEDAVNSIVLGTPLKISEKKATGCIIKRE